MPGLSYHFGIKPWEIGLLTPRELNAYLESLADIAREARRR